MIDPHDGDEDGRDEALDLAEPQLGRQPAADQAADDPDDDVGQAATGGLATDQAPEIAPAMKPTTIHPMKFISSIGGFSHG